MKKTNSMRNLNKSTGAYLKTPDTTDSKHHYFLKSVNETSEKGTALGIIASTAAVLFGWVFVKNFKN